MAIEKLPRDLPLVFDDFAVLSFVDVPCNTLVLRNIESEWKIVHMHAPSFDAEGELPTLDANFVE